MPHISVYTKYILITGANSGIGAGLVAQFIHHQKSQTESERKPLYLILCCRNIKKLQQLMQEWQSEIDQFQLNICMQSKSLDLCQKESIQDFARFLKQFPQLDVFYANAGCLFIDGILFGKGILQLFKDPSVFFTDMSFVMKQTVGKLQQDGLGYLFCSNTFGHYCLLDECRDLIKRVVWTSSQTSDPQYLDFKDLQALKSKHPYESSKIMCELLSLQLNQEGMESFVCDPGVVASSIVGGQIHWLVYYGLMIPIFYIARLFLDCLTITAFNGANSLFYCSPIVERQLNPEMKYTSASSYFKTPPNYVLEKKMTNDRVYTAENGRKVEQYLKQVKRDWFSHE